MTIEQLLSPSRVAVIGATSRETGLGARTLRHLADAGFPGEIVRARSAEDVDGRVDIAVVAVPAAAVQEILTGLDGKATHVIVYSSGFDEADGATQLRAGGIRLLGPNTVGLHYAPSRTMLNFAAAFDDMTDCRHGSGVVLLSQSGAFGARLLRSARRHGVDYDGFIGTGNEHDHSAVELATDLVRSETHRPRTVALYLESVRDAAALETMLAAARDAGVPVAVLLGGRSTSGADAARSHTAAVSPDHTVLTELCRMYGAVVVGSDRELVDATVALSMLKPARGNRVGVVTGSGGAGVVAADILSDRGLVLAPLSPATRESLRALLPTFASVTNPVDVTAQAIADTGTVAAVRSALVDSGEVDAVLVIGRAEQAAEVAGDHGAPVVLAVLDGDATSVAEFVRAGAPVLPTLEAACNAIRALATHGADEPGVTPDGTAGEPPDLGDTIASMRVLEAAGVPVAPWREASDVESAVQAGAEIGWPVVVKANLPTLAHKAAAGGIRLDVGPDDIEAAARDLLRVAPSIMVASQLRGSPELFAGVRRDPQFGLVTAAGLGGGHIELLGRVVTVPGTAPARWLAERLRTEVFGHAGHRYSHLPELLAATAATLTDLAVRHGLDLVECNPLIEIDSRLIALDARVVAP
jgi:acyl-CoA synthetase (NDP forming)